MASELKPCPFCGSSDLETYYADIEGWIAHIKCIDCDDMIGPMSEFKYETQEEAYEDASKRWNTRPTPVAPVSPDATGKCGELVTYRPERMSIGGMVADKDGGYVTRSQAVELLAAERAKYRDAMEKLVESQRETLVWQQQAIDLKADNAAKDERLKDCRSVINEFKRDFKKLEADNAALTARVKELEEAHDHWMQENIRNLKKLQDAISSAEALEAKLAVRTKTAQTYRDFARQEKKKTEALEAKLAAAEKALEGLREKGRKVLDVLKAWEDDGDLVNSGKIVSDFRAVLGGKPS